MGSLNTLLLSCAKIGEFEKAEEWFSRCGMPALHPELIGLSPTTESYNIMIKMFIGAGELQRAEKWIQALEAEMLVRPTLATSVRQRSSSRLWPNNPARHTTHC